MSGGGKLIEFSVGSITSSQTSDGVSSLLAPMWAAWTNFVCDKERGRKRGSEDGKNSLVSILLVALLAHSRRVNPQDKKFRNKSGISQAPPCQPDRSGLNSPRGPDQINDQSRKLGINRWEINMQGQEGEQEGGVYGRRHRHLSQQEKK
jgi:hypothetical protein